jgi:hypothetical protein
MNSTYMNNLYNGVNRTNQSDILSNQPDDISSKLVTGAGIIQTVAVATLAAVLMGDAVGCGNNNETQLPKTQTTDVSGAKSPRYKEHREQIIIPGTWRYDLDSMRLPYGPEKFRNLISYFNAKLSFDPKKLKYGASPDNCDLFLNQIDSDTRRLEFINGAQGAILGKRFEDVTLEDLSSANYNTDPIEDTTNNPLEPGTVIAFKTADGKLGKLRFDGFSELGLPGKPNMERYNLEATVVSYSPTK